MDEAYEYPELEMGNFTPNESQEDRVRAIESEIPHCMGNFEKYFELERRIAGLCIPEHKANWLRTRLEGAFYNHKLYVDGSWQRVV